MGLTTDPNDPGIRETREDGQQQTYLVLSDEERQKGFVRPVRTRYKHVGCRPQYPTRLLTDEEQQRYATYGYVVYEEYPPSDSAVVGKFWTEKQLHGGCGSVTTMGQALAETYAHDPEFYSGTFCVYCHAHFPVREFIWEPDGSPVGS